MNPWICPKCGKVYGPLVMECASCNQKRRDTSIADTLPSARTIGITPGISEDDAP